VLKSYPDLIARVLPNIWAKIVEQPWQVPVTFEIADDDVKMGFTSLISGKFGTGKHCFCFFIDGLDEFEPTTQIDHKDVVESLRRWTKTARGNLKLCVSSREENVFMNAFSEDPNIRLHDLTRQDMIMFVRNKLSHVPARDGKEKFKLFVDLVDKAQGIFLWVTLVVRSMREQVESGASIGSLREELDYLPDQLEGLYEHILGSLSKKSRSMAYRIFKILEASKKYHIYLPLIAYSFLEEYTKDEKFAMKEDFSQSGVGGLTAQGRKDRAVKLLRGYCKGLVEVPGDDTVDYAHRSVQEFLQTANIKGDIHTGLNDFNALATISMLALALFRLKLAFLYFRRDSFWLTSFLHVRAIKGLDEPPYSFLTCLESALGPLPWADMTYPYEVITADNLIWINTCHVLLRSLRRRFRLCQVIQGGWGSPTPYAYI
jgi:hypothetical protein